MYYKRSQQDFLFRAAAEDPKVIDQYIRNGGDVNCSNKYGDTLLHLAAESGNLENVRLLLKNGASLCLRNYYGDTPLHWSVKSQNEEVILLFLECGADPDALNLYAETPYHWALNYRSFKIYEILVKQSEKYNAAIRTDNYDTLVENLKKRFAFMELGGEIIFYLQYYYPYSSSKFDWRSERILKFKDGDYASVRYYFDLLSRYLSPLLPEDCAFAVIPSSTAYKYDGGIYMLVSTLTRNKFIDASRVLVRHKSKPKAHYGGDRSISSHLKTIVLQNTELIRNRIVILFDDVVTSGNSILACRELLMKAGAKSVVSFVLSRTIRQ